MRVYVEASAGGKLVVEEPESTALAVRLDLLEPDAVTYRTAGLLPGANLRSLAALHVAAGLQVVSPGA